MKKKFKYCNLKKKLKIFKNKLKFKKILLIKNKLINFKNHKKKKLDYKMKSS